MLQEYRSLARGFCTSGGGRGRVCSGRVRMWRETGLFAEQERALLLVLVTFFNKERVILNGDEEVLDCPRLRAHLGLRGYGQRTGSVP